MKVTEEEYREALEIWLQKHPGKTVNDVPVKEVVVLLSGELVNLGIRISTIKRILRGKSNNILTEDQYAYWVTEKGLSIENQKEMRKG